MSESPAKEINSLLLPLIFSGALATGSAVYAFFAHKRLVEANKANQKLINRVEEEIRNQEEQKRKNEQLLKNKDHERAGRITAEKKLRVLSNLSKSSAAPPDGAVSFKPIGFVQSCFKERNGTPRQGGVVPSARALLKLDRTLNPNESLEGLEKYTHVWLLFLFHENTNTARDVLHPTSTIKSKVRPPRLNGLTVGLFASRTPHRPCAIGLSVVRLEKVVKDTLFLAGADLIDGTPVFDVKPYVPEYDSVPAAQVPDWMVHEFPAHSAVTWTKAGEEAMQKCLPHLELYSTLEDIKALVNDVLKSDIRRTNHRLSEVSLYNFRVDNVRVYVNFMEGGVEVLDCKVEVGTPYSRRPDNEKPDLSPPSPAPAIVKEGEYEAEDEPGPPAQALSSSEPKPSASDA